MDTIIETVKTMDLRQRPGDHRVNCLCYADDTVLLAESEDDLQRLLHAFKITVEQYNIEISTTKTKSMTIAKETLRCKLSKYSATKTLEKIRRQINRAAFISGHLKQVIWNYKYLSIECKSRIYKTCIRPVLSYAVEAEGEQLCNQKDAKNYRNEDAQIDSRVHIVG
ncbi:hypothetical protein P5V15_002739 [Pogonomyrmex californicus]